MSSAGLPTAFYLLREERTEAAGAALVQALPHLEPPARTAAVAILAKRPDWSAPARLVGQFSECGEALRSVIVAHADDLHSATRQAITSPHLSFRLSAIELTVRSHSFKNAYLLADAIRSRCPKTCERAAEALCGMVERLLRRDGGRASSAAIGERHAEATCLANALGWAVMGWEIHFRPEVVVAALRMGDWLDQTIRCKLKERRTRLRGMLSDLLERTSDPHLAGFVLRALAIPELRAPAGRAISRAESKEFIRAVLAHTWLLADPEIERGCRWIRGLRWFRSQLTAITELEGRLAEGAVRLLGAAGGRREQKLELYRELVGLNHQEVRRAVVWQLAGDLSEGATALLALIAGRSSDAVAGLATRELRRRRATGQAVHEDRATGAAGDWAWNVGEVASADRTSVEWRDGFGDRTFGQVPTGSKTGARRAGDPTVRLRAKLRSLHALDRLEAMRVVRDRGLAKDLAELVYRLAHDTDPLVRSVAVAGLVDLPGVTSVRILRAAVNDPDERVQANAIEALDLLDVEGRAVCTEPKLESSSSRVRANAVKSLLRLEQRQAGEVLLRMLDDPSHDHRLSALWVIGSLKLRAVTRQVLEMGRSDPDERVRERARRVMHEMASQPGTWTRGGDAALGRAHVPSGVRDVT